MPDLIPNICEAERRMWDLRKWFLPFMLSHCRACFIYIQWWIVGPCPVEWSYQVMCVMEASSSAGNPHIFWVVEIGYYQSVHGTDPNRSLFGHCFGLGFYTLVAVVYHSNNKFTNQKVEFATKIMLTKTG